MTRSKNNTFLLFKHTKRAWSSHCSVCKQPLPRSSCQAVAHKRCLDIKGRQIRHNAEYFAELRAMESNAKLSDEEIYERYIA